MAPIKYILLFIALVSFLSCKINSIPSNHEKVIVLTFDDEHESIYTTALPMLNEFGYPSTSFINTEWIGLEENLTWEQVCDLEFNHSWETGGHTLHHINMPYYEEETVEYEVLQDKQNMIDHGINPVSFALPSGHATQEQLQFLSELYQNVRNSQDQRHIVPINRLNLGYYSYKSENSASSAISRIIRGIENGENIIVIGFHRIINELDSHPNACTPEDFREILEFIQSSNLEVTTLKNAVDRFCSN